MMEKGQVWERDILCSGNDESEVLFTYFIIFLLSLGLCVWHKLFRSSWDEGSALKAAVC